MSTLFGMSKVEIEEAPFIVKKEEYYLKCQVCEYEWPPRIAKRLPVACPRCQSRSWKGASKYED